MLLGHGRILQMWWRAKCEGVYWPPPLSERLYEGMVIDMLEAKRLLQRHLWAHGGHLGLRIGQRSWLGTGRGRCIWVFDVQQRRPH